MNTSQKQKYTEELENIIYQLGELMVDIIRITLNTLDDYQQFCETDAFDDRPF
jgi:hypothetical protein